MAERALTKREKKLYPNVQSFTEDGKPIFKKKIKEISILNKRDRVEKVLYVIIFIVMCIHAFTLIFPTVCMLISSLTESNEYIDNMAAGKVFALPQTWHWQNYVDAFRLLKVERVTFGGMIFNSLWYTIVKTFLNVMIPAFCAYVMCKYRFFGREALFAYIIITMTLPIYGSGAAYMRLVSELGYRDTPLYVVIANLGGFSASFLVFNGFFRSVSNSYSEAAKIEGANAFQIYFLIILPQAMSVLLTYGIIGAIANWNVYEEILLYLPSFPTLATGLMQFQDGRDAVGLETIQHAGYIISAIPTMLLFSLFSKKIMTSLSIGGLKG